MMNNPKTNFTSKYVRTEGSNPLIQEAYFQAMSKTCHQSIQPPILKQPTNKTNNLVIFINNLYLFLNFLLIYIVIYF